MKKLLILAEKHSKEKKMLAKYLARAFIGQSRVVLGKFSDLSFKIDGKNTRALFSGEKISDFDLVIFRQVSKEFLPVATSLAVCLEFMKVRYFDTAYGQSYVPGNKLISLIKLSLAGLPIPPSFFCWRTKIEDNLDLIVEKFPLPLIAKEIRQQRGRGVFLIRNRRDFEMIQKTPPDWQFFFQPFFANTKEYRIGVFNYQPAIFYQKIATNKEEFRRNTDLGAKEKYFDVCQAPEEMRRAAVLAAKTLKLEAAGVDFLVDDKEKLWILEANHGLGFTYDTKISPELPTFASFVAEQLGLKKR